MSTLIAYGIGALVVLAALTGAYQYVDNHWVTDAGVSEGQRLKQEEWDAANVKADKEAKEQREKDELAARIEARRLEDALVKQRRLNRDLTQAINSHIAAAKFHVSCKLTPELHNDWNRAAAGTTEGDAGGSVSGSGGAPAPVK